MKIEQEICFQRSEKNWRTGSKENHIPLKGEFKGLFRLRIGEYRVIYAKTDKES